MSKKSKVIKRFFKDKLLTFVEILVILGIISLLLMSIITIIKPLKLLSLARDNIRKKDLIELSGLLNISYSEFNKNLFRDRLENLLGKLFVSLPQESCENIISSYTISCVSSPSDINNPWLPLRLSSLLSVKKFNIDPINKGEYFYAFMLQSSVSLRYILFTKLETTNEYFVIEGEIGGSYSQITTSSPPVAIEIPQPPPSPLNQNPPNTPTNLRAVNITTSSISVSWDNVPNTSYYNLEISIDQNFNNIIHSNNVYNNFFTFTNLTPSTTYFIRLKAINSYGSSEYVSIQASTLPSDSLTSTTFVKGITSDMFSYFYPVKILVDNQKIEIWGKGWFYEFVENISSIELDYNGNILRNTLLTAPTNSDWSVYINDISKEIDGYIGVGGLYDNVVTTTICNENNTCGYSLYRGFLFRLDNNKNLIWAKSIGRGIDGNYIPVNCPPEMGGGFCGYDPNSVDILYHEHLNKIIKTGDGYLLVGSLVITRVQPLKEGRPATSTGHLLVIKTDFNGNLLWSKRITFPGYEITNAGYLEFTDGLKIGNYYYLSGIFSNTTTLTHPAPFHSRDGLIAKLDLNGNIIWIKMYQLTNGVDTFNRIIKMLDDNLLITGTYASFSYDPHLVKLNLNGDVIKAVGIYPLVVKNGGEGGHDLIITSDGNYAMIAGGASGAMVFAKVDSNLNIKNTSVFRIGEDQWTNRLIEIPAGYLVAGEFNNAAPFECVTGPSGTAGLYIAKLNSEGALNCGCSGTSTGFYDITNNILIYNTNFEVNNYEIFVYNFQPGQIIKTRSNLTNTEYCRYPF